MKTISIIFDGPPAPRGGRFVEVNDENGRSLNAPGEWRQKENGLWELVLDVEAIAAMAPRPPRVRPTG